MTLYYDVSKYLVDYYKMSTEYDSHKIKVRFAPAPSGLIHPGNARSAIMNYVLAKTSDKNTFILRIDDTNEEKVSNDAIEILLKDLEWLSIVPDQVEQQSHRTELYMKIFQLLKKYNFIYPCARLNQYPDMPKTFKRIRRDSCEVLHVYNDYDYGWRFEIKEGKSTWNDMVLGEQSHEPIKMASDPVVFREGGHITYLLASAIDDIFMGITHIIRGQDHVSNTAIQIQMINSILDIITLEKDEDLLKEILKSGTQSSATAKNIKFGHLPLLSFEDGQKFSKRTNSLSIKSLREDGILPITLNNYLLSLGTNHITEFSSNDEILHNFSNVNFDEFFSDIGKASATFSMQNLLHLNQRILAKMTKDDVYQYIKNMECAYVDHLNDESWNLIKDNALTLNEIVEWLGVLYDNQIVYCKHLAAYLDQYEEDHDLCEFFQIAVDKIHSIDTKCINAWNDFANHMKENTDKKGSQLFMPIRIALTGKEHGPKMNVLFSSIDKGIIIHRFQECIV